jgi:hypothetical protein
MSPTWDRGQCRQAGRQLAAAAHMLCCHRTRSHTTQTPMINEHYNKTLLTRQVYPLLMTSILHKVMNMLKKIMPQKSKHVHKACLCP